MKTNLIVLFLFLSVNILFSQTTDDYRSATSGNWNVTSSWERYNGTSWVAASGSPTSTNNIITIRNGHVISVTANVTIDQSLIEVGGKLVLTSGTITIANGSGNDLQIFGEYERISSTTTMTINASASVSCESGGVYNHNVAGGSLPTITWQDGSLLKISNSISSGLNQSFWNVTKTFGNATTLSNDNTNRIMTIRNDFNLEGGTFYLKNGGLTGGIHSIIVKGNLLHSGGVFGWNSNASDNTSITNIIVEKNFIISGTASWGGNVSATNCSSGVFFEGTGNQIFSTILSHSTSSSVRDRFYYKTIGGPTGLSEIYNGTTPQETIDGSCGTSAPTGYSRWPSSANLLKSLTINNSTGVTLRSPKSIGENLFLQSGLLTTNGNLTMFSNATIDRSGGTISETPLGTSYNVIYSPFSSGYDTSVEIPIADSVLQNLTVNNGNTITLNPNVININANLTIQSGNFQINEDKVVFLQNQYINTGGLCTFENNSSLVQVNNVINSGNIIYKRIAQARNLDYVYWSSPVAAFNVNNLPNNNRYIWNTTIANTNGGQGNWVSASGNMLAGTGYIARASNGSSTPIATTTIFNGVPNNAVVSIPILRGSYQGIDYPGTNGITITRFSDNWNLVGNPYPSSINVEDFLNLNTNIEGAVRIWTHGTLPSTSITNPFYGSYQANYTPNDYITYNGTGTVSGPTGFNGYIASGQGFLVNMLDGSSSSDNLIFNNSLRNKNHDNSQFYRNSSIDNSLSNQKNRIWLDLIDSNNLAARTLIGYVTDATYSKDRLFDAVTSVSNVIHFYSIIDEDKMTIQGRTIPFDSNDIVNLGYYAPSSGNYSIAIAAVDGLFDDNQEIYLEDKLTGIIHDLRQTTYTFNTIAGEINNRFVLRYNNETLDSETFNNNSQILVISNENILTIKSFTKNIKEIYIYNLLGQKIYTGNMTNNNEKIISSLAKTNSTLMICLKLSNDVIIVKKVIH
jgi:hypothetical protein